MRSSMTFRTEGWVGPKGQPAVEGGGYCSSTEEVSSEGLKLDDRVGGSEAKSVEEA